MTPSVAFLGLFLANAFIPSAHRDGSSGNIAMILLTNPLWLDSFKVLTVLKFSDFSVAVIEGSAPLHVHAYGPCSIIARP